jgi:hypothetical protein
MYSVYWWMDGELHKECCGRGKESAVWAWRIVVAYLEYRAWMEYEKWN